MERELRHFVTVAEKGSVTLAAAALGLTQSALTKSLQRLEARLGLSLLERGPRGSKPTEAGAAILARANSVEAELRYLELEAAEFRSKIARQLRIGASPSWATSVLPTIIGGVRDIYPGIQIDTYIDLESRMIDALKDGSVDFAISGSVPSPAQHGIEFHPIMEIDTLVACRRGHPLCGRWSGDVDTLFAADWLDYRSALERPRGDRKPLSHAITGVINKTQSWAMVPLIAARSDILVVLPEQLAEYISLFGLEFLSQDVRVSTISAGVWCRTSVAETRIGKTLLARIRAEMTKMIPEPHAPRRFL